MHQTSKQDIRSQLKSKVRALPKAERDILSRELSAKLQNLLSTEDGVWGGFIPLESEPSIFPLPASKITWAFPKIENQTMKFAVGDEFEKGPHGITQPVVRDDSAYKTREEIKGFVIPGLGFSDDGYRIGWGAGYYDRYLKGFKGSTIGVCFDFQILPTAAWVEEFDFPVNQVVTPTTMFKCKESSWK